METTIRETGILEFKALTMSKAIFMQLADDIGSLGVITEDDIVGRVNLEGNFWWAIIKTKYGGLCKMLWLNLWSLAQANVAKQNVRMEHEIIRNELWVDMLNRQPQIFLK